MVAEGAIVGVLLDGHDLQRIVAQAADARQHLLGKCRVCIDLRQNERCLSLCLACRLGCCQIALMKAPEML